MRSGRQAMLRGHRRLSNGGAIAPADTQPAAGQGRRPTARFGGFPVIITGTARPAVSQRQKLPRWKTPLVGEPTEDLIEWGMRNAECGMANVRVHGPNAGENVLSGSSVPNAPGSQWALFIRMRSKLQMLACLRAAFELVRLEGHPLSSHSCCMKGPLSFLAFLVLGTWTAFGQGLVDFRNEGLPFPTVADRKVYAGPNNPLTGVNFVAGLWYLPGADRGGEIFSVGNQAGRTFNFRPPTTRTPGTWVVAARVSPLFVI